MQFLKKCELSHGHPDKAAVFYRHQDIKRFCMRLYGTDEWIYDPAYEEDESGSID